MVKLRCLVMLAFIFMAGIVSASTFEYEEEEIRWTDPLPPPPPEPVDVGYQYNGSDRIGMFDEDNVLELFWAIIPLVTIAAILISILGVLGKSI